MNKFIFFYPLLILLVISVFVNGQNTERIQSLQSSLQNSDTDIAKITLLLQLSSEYESSDINKAVYYSHQAYELALEFEEGDFVCTTTIEYINCLYNAGLYDSLLNELNSSRNFIIECNDSLKVAKIYLLEGSAHRKVYNFNRAKTVLKKAIAYFGANNNEFKANAYNRIGLCHLYMAEYDSSIINYFAAREVFEDINDTTGIIKVLVNIGKIYFKQEDNPKAKFYWLKAKDLLESKENLKFESLILINLGMLETTLENYEMALEYYRKAYDISDLIRDNKNKGDISSNIGVIYVRMGLYEKALEQYYIALNLFHNLNYHQGEIYVRNNISAVYSQKNKHKTALAILDTVLQLARENNLLKEVLFAYKNIAVNLYNNGNYRPAYDTLRKWKDLNDSIFNIDKAESIAKLELKYEKEKNESKILALENKTLQKDLEIKQKINQRNLISGSGIAIVIILSLLFFFHRQRSRKDRIIKEKEISRLKEEKKALAAQSIVEGQEEERKRVARELHDGLGVLLSNVKMQFSSFMDKSSGNKELLSKAASVLNQASVDVRRISHNMMPGNLSKFGLVAAIEDLFEEISDSGVINAEIKTDLIDERFSENKEIMLYRIVQELANNTIKHAGASSISLNINKIDHKILVNYADNGSGFDPKKVISQNSLGLKSIEDRVNFLGGEMSIESSSGKGSSFGFDFPV